MDISRVVFVDIQFLKIDSWVTTRIVHIDHLDISMVWFNYMWVVVDNLMVKYDMFDPNTCR
jgi:hypothetical protein